MKPEDLPDQVTDHAPETPQLNHPGDFSSGFKMGLLAFLLTTGAIIAGVVLILYKIFFQ
jgi:hypothetical protein